MCPMPVIRTQSRIGTLAPGDTLEVTATDRGALVDIPAWCRVHGHRILEAREEQGEFRITIEVGTV